MDVVLVDATVKCFHITNDFYYIFHLFKKDERELDLKIRIGITYCGGFILCRTREIYQL